MASSGGDPYAGIEKLFATEQSAALIVGLQSMASSSSEPYGYMIRVMALAVLGWSRAHKSSPTLASDLARSLGQAADDLHAFSKAIDALEK